jgi:hypothetical protein
MLTIEEVFQINLFNDHSRISGDRFYNFSEDTLERVKEQNKNGDFADIEKEIEPYVLAYRGFVSDVGLGISQQLGITRTSDEVIALFGTRMSFLFDGISYKLGGQDKPGFLEIYPHGKSEYSRVPKEKMGAITDRLFKAAANHAGDLETDITKELQSFKTMWEDARDHQSGNKSDTGTHRSDRDTARLDLELALTRTVYKIAARFSGDPEKCKVFFDFHLLYAPTHEKKPTPPKG